jgi:hypothetical protein
MINNNIINKLPAMVSRSIFIHHQYSDPLASGAGSTEVFSMKNDIARTPVLQKKDSFDRSQYPKPLESNIGKEDLPGGFLSEDILSGQHAPLTDLTRGVVQRDDVKILFQSR